MASDNTNKTRNMRRNEVNPSGWTELRCDEDGSDSLSRPKLGAPRPGLDTTSILLKDMTFQL